MKVGLAGFDLADPTDRAVAKNLSAALRRRGHRVVVSGCGRPKAAADVWHLHQFGRDARGFIAAAERGRWRVATTLHLVLPDYLPFAGGAPTLRRLAKLGPVAAVCDAQRRVVLGLGVRARVTRSYGPSLKPPSVSRGRGRNILCAARLAPYKGGDVLLLAFAMVLERAPDARLVLAGRDKTSGGLAAFARRLGLAGRVEFVGELSPAALARRLAAADIFVLPSRRENFPIALLEAMAAGKPCVASRTGGVPELTGRAGALLVAPGDPAALARALGRVLSDGALRRRLCGAARRRASLFTWDRAAAESLALLR